VVDSIFEDVIEPFFSTHDEYTFLLTSTPSGDAGYFYRKVQIDDEWHSPRWPTGICPLVDTEWLAEKERTVDSRTFKTEYLGEFIGSSDRFFDPGVIDSQMQQDATATRSGMVLGADIARAGDDRTVIVGIGSDSVAEVLVADRELTLTDAAGRIARIADTHDIRSVAVDETGLGAGVVEMLESDIERLVSGVKFSLETKQSLYNRCKSMLENDELTLSYDGQLLASCDSLSTR